MTVKAQASPEPEVFVDLDALNRETTHEPFRFKYGGKVRTLPHMRDLTWRQQLDLDLDTAGLIDELVRETDPALADELLNAKTFVVEGLFGNWRKHAGIMPGESSASTDS